MNNAGLYHQANSMQMADAIEILKEHRDKLTWSSGEKILDVGCGPGNSAVTVIEPITPQGSTIVGCDISEEMISYAQEVYGNKRRYFRKADISDMRMVEALGEPEGSFDKVFSFYCLHWIRNQKQAAQNIYKMLKSGGYGFLVFLSYQPVGAMHQIVSQKPLWEPYIREYERILSPYHNSVDPAKEYSDLLKSCGFEVLFCLNRPSSFQFPSVKDFLDMMISVNPFYERIPDGLQKAYVDEMWSAFRDAKLVDITDDGAVVHRYNLLVAVIKKP